MFKFKKDISVNKKKIKLFKKLGCLAVVGLVCGVGVLAGLDNITRAEEEKPDLTPSIFEINNTNRDENEAFQYGDIVNIDIGILNNGAKTENEFYYTVSFDGESCMRSNVLGLDSKDTYTFAHKIMWPHDNNQDIEFIFNVDEKNNVNEIYEDNNIWTRTIIINHPIEDIITNIQVINITSAEATITWNTTEEVRGYAWYREYGDGDNWMSKVSDEHKKEHSVLLDNLRSATTYEYYITALDAQVNMVDKSEVKTFKTINDADQNIVVISPNGGEKWVIGNTYEITWEKLGIDQVVVDLYKNDVFFDSLVISSIEKVSWRVWQKYLINLPGDRYKIKIFNRANPDIFDESDDYFSIVDSVTTCTDSDGGKNYYVKGIVILENEIRTDRCMDSQETYPEQVQGVMIEYYCEDNKIKSFNYVCSNGCKDGACIKDANNKYEQVKCIFKNSNKIQECYLAENNDEFKCSGKESCVINVYGEEGKRLTWKSTCGGYGYTKIDGEDETIEFNCLRDERIIEIEDNASNLFQNKLTHILSELKQLRDIVKEQQTQIKYLAELKKDVVQLSQTVENAINNFITYGVDDNTKRLGAGERAAVMHSFKSAFKKLPETEDELADAIKIANGRWPSLRSDNAEKQAKEQFKKIYKKIADMNNPNDNAAVTVMAYGLRQKAENRNLDSERQGIKTFQHIYGYHPASTEDWNIMQSITYSGSSRGIDTDGDLLLDEREAEFGTDPNNPDSDGDGYLDGAEVASGFDPLEK